MIGVAVTVSSFGVSGSVGIGVSSGGSGARFRIDG